jgi:hypothetical protein
MKGKHGMTTHDPVREDIDRRLREAIASLRKETLRVEIWAAALASFSRPAPQYRLVPREQPATPIRRLQGARKDD